MSKKIKLYSTNRSFGTVEQNASTDESRTIDLVWTTGAKGLRSTRDGYKYYEELAVTPSAIDSSRMVGNPLLASHDSENLDSIIGVIESVTIDPIKKEGRAQVRFAKDEYSERVFQKVKDKIINNVSVGYRIDDFKDVTQKGDEIPTYRAEKWTPFEISLVGIGFDKDAQVRSDDPTTELEINEKVEQQITESIIQFKPEPQAQQRGNDMTEAEKQVLELAAKKQAALEEKQRQNEIRLAVRSAKLEESFADDLIEKDLSGDQARKLVLEKLAAIQPTPPKSEIRVEVGEDNSQKRRQGFEEAMLHRMDSKNFKVTEESKSFYGKSVLRQIEQFIPRYTMESDVQFAKRAMSSSDLPLTLANVAEKSLQSQYALAPRTYTEWTKKDTLRNYKQNSQVKAGDFASLLARPEGEEFQQGSTGEDREVVQLSDYGIVHAFTSQMLINDDLGVLSRLASSGGIAAARLENKLAYDALKTNKTMNDGVVLYHATHNNLGSASAINIAAIALATARLRKQTSTNSADPLNLTASFFICGPDKEQEAKQFFAAVNANQNSQVNIYSGSMKVIIDAQLTGNQWYMACDPNLVDTVTMYHLEGQENPMVESRVNFKTNSLELKVAHAVAAAPMDYRGIQYNPGA